MDCKKAVIILTIFLILISSISAILVYHYYSNCRGVITLLVDKYAELCVIYCFPNEPVINENLQCLCKYENISQFKKILES